MVFYFSGTGNSYQAALAVRSETEALYNMTDCLQRGERQFSLAPGEALGFVLPVYFGGIPSLVREFIAQLTVSGEIGFCYAVFTCGAKSYAAGDMLAEALKKRGVTLSADYTVVMPDNYVLVFEIAEEPERDHILAAAAKKLAGIRARIDARVGWRQECTAADKAVTRLMYPLYENGRRTKKFYTDDQCVRCGVCASRCPVKAIVMVDGRPTWVKDRCVQCMACIRCGAVQYGKSTVGKKRYTNPILKKPAAGHSHH